MSQQLFDRSNMGIKYKELRGEWKEIKKNSIQSFEKDHNFFSKG